MLLRSCVSAFRHYVRNTPKPILNRTFFTNGRNSLWAETSIDSKTGKIKVDTSKRVTLLLEKSDGTIRKETGYVNESIYDLINRIDPEKEEFTGYGVCGGTTTCSTCHVILNEKDFNRLQPASDDELDLIGYAPENCEYSRLSCCIFITEEMEGTVLKFPSSIADYRGEDEVKENGI